MSKRTALRPWDHGSVQKGWTSPFINTSVWWNLIHCGSEKGHKSLMGFQSTSNNERVTKTTSNVHFWDTPQFFPSVSNFEMLSITTFLSMSVNRSRFSFIESRYFTNKKINDKETNFLTKWEHISRLRFWFITTDATAHITYNSFLETRSLTRVWY